MNLLLPNLTSNFLNMPYMCENTFESMKFNPKTEFILLLLLPFFVGTTSKRAREFDGPS